MHVRCPHCRNPIEIVEDSSFKNIVCFSCGSSFSLVGNTDVTETGRMPAKTIGQFELVEQAGVGAFGTVWKAKDTQLDRTVAIKIPRNGQLSEEETEKFLREARAAAQLHHANIVSVHEVGKSDDTVYIVSDYVEGADLKEWMRGRPMPPKEAAELCAKIAEALHHAHEQGVIHRDLKPSNIMMDLNGQPHIMDFGLAKRESGEVTMTVDGAILGTPAYMSPEQAKGKGHEADRRSDVYSLGTMLFQMLTAELPFRGEKRMLAVNILTEEPPNMRRLNPRVPKDLQTICLKCMEKEPHLRYATAKELEEELRCFVTGAPIKARPAGIAERMWRWCRKRPAVASLIAAFLSLLLSVAVVTPIAVTRHFQMANRNEQLVQERSAALDEVDEERRVAEELEKKLAVRVTPQARIIESVSISFIPNRIDVELGDYSPAIDRLIQLAGQLPQSRIVIQGHSDPTMTLVTAIKAGIKEGVLIRSGPRGQATYLLNDQPLDISNTSEMVRLIEEGVFEADGVSAQQAMRDALNLSHRRAQAVHDELLSFAEEQHTILDRQRIKVIAAGMTQPIIGKPGSMKDFKLNTGVEVHLMSGP